MQELKTLGKQKPFSYEGSIKNGIHLNYTGNPTVTAEFFRHMLSSLSGKTLKGGFSMTDPPSDGFGYWLKEHSKHHKTTTLTPRHGSHIAAILVHEGYATSFKERNAIYLKFKRL